MRVSSTSGLDWERRRSSWSRSLSSMLTDIFEKLEDLKKFVVKFRSENFEISLCNESLKADHREFHFTDYLMIMQHKYS